eukprot:TRINITY_DN36389_c0_g1_i1.p1 TRINITY_DN36389_c0_g1~~TRINITY_DN36389_c0_g1_i1.p1  ORF type:complete len:487 (+),score=92.26 TRINITY_DN36389_c0_g1_i1:133-1593(+)
MAANHSGMASSSFPSQMIFAKFQPLPQQVSVSTFVALRPSTLSQSSVRGSGCSTSECTRQSGHSGGRMTWRISATRCGTDVSHDPDALNEATPTALQPPPSSFSSETSLDSAPIPSASSPPPSPSEPLRLSFGANRVPIRPANWSPEDEAEEERQRAKILAALGGVTIRRRPPHGPPTHHVGPFEFLLESETNVPQNILEEIVWHKDGEVGALKEKMPLGAVMKAMQGVAPARDFVGALRKRREETGVPALIAEVKKASPSRGVIQPDFDPVRIGRAYETGGAACLSVLTDTKYFQGSFENLKLIREAGVQCPLLCKEFIVDAWQLYYARLHGADAVLLISAVLRDEDLSYMMRILKKLGMAALIEVHTKEEMDRVLGLEGVELIGINNRDLGTFKVDIDNTRRLLEGERGAAIRERGIIVVGESGLFTPADVAVVETAGCGAVLVGESLVKQNDPCAGIAALFGKDISRAHVDAPLIAEAAPLPA